jgi:hypothetical protein
VHRGLLALDEDAGGFHHDVHAQLAPGQRGRVLDGRGAHLFAVYDEVVIVIRDLTPEFAVVRVVFEKLRQGLVIGKIVDQRYIVAALVQDAENLPPDAPETVDAYLHICLHDAKKPAIPAEFNLSVPA